MWDRRIINFHSSFSSHYSTFWYRPRWCNTKIRAMHNSLKCVISKNTLYVQAAQPSPIDISVTLLIISILYFFKCSQCTHFSLLLSHTSNMLEYHSLSSVRILKTEDFLTSRMECNLSHHKVSACLYNNIVNTGLCIFITK